ncbi:SDR family oxidoreductase [Lentisphaerota bacterium WC36G]|nr:SDR family oxidoreductase [Lentisphaerae bacterium WC36]
MKRLVVITGANSGIGKATALKFYEAGYPLLLLDKNISGVKKLKLDNCLCQELDVTDIKSYKNAIEKGKELFGEIGTLINNAGIMLADTIETQSPQEWQAMLNINVLGVLNGLHCILDEMKKNQFGTIINLGSVAGKKAFTNHAIYCGTKAAVLMISENIRQDIAESNIRVVTISPGAVATNLLTQMSNKEIQQASSDWQKDLGDEILNADNIADAMLFAHEQPQHVCIREIVIAPTKQVP